MTHAMLIGGPKDGVIFGWPPCKYLVLPGYDYHWYVLSFDRVTAQWERR